MRWPWQRRETREAREARYTDLIIRALVGRATGADADVKGSGALEIAAGIVGRAFAAARPVDAGRAEAVLTPACLALIGREMVRTGEALFVIEAARGLELIPVYTWDVTGAPSPSTWLYRVDLAGPTIYRTRRVPAADVVSCRWAVDPARPWCGVDPLTSAHLSGQLHAKTVEALRDEAGGPVGNLIPVPKDPDNSLDEVRSTIAGLKGGAALLESMFDMWGQSQDRNRAGWDPKRIGAAPGAALVDLHSAAVRVALACCGIPAELADAGVDATSRREAWRQFLHSTVAPLGRIVADELREKLELPDGFRFDWTELAAGDTQGRARATHSLAQAGVELERALTLTGFAEPARGAA